MNANFKKMFLLMLIAVGLVSVQQSKAFADDSPWWQFWNAGQQQQANTSTDSQNTPWQPWNQNPTPVVDQSILKQHQDTLKEHADLVAKDRQVLQQDQQTLRDAYQKLQQDRQSGADLSAAQQAVNDAQKNLKNHVDNLRTDSQYIRQDKNTLRQDYGMPARNGNPPQRGYNGNRPWQQNNDRNGYFQRGDHPYHHHYQSNYGKNR